MKASVRFDKGRGRWRLSIHHPTGDSRSPYRRERRWFEREEDARAELRAAKTSFQRHGAVVSAGIDRTQYARLLALEQSVAARGTSLEAVVSKYLELVVAEKRSELLEEAALQFIWQKEKEKCQDSYISQIRRYLARLHRKAGRGATVADVKFEALQRFVWGGTKAPETRARERATLVNFLGFCHTRGWVSENLALKIETPKIIRPEPVIASVDDVRRLMWHLWGKCAEVIPYAALRLFAGIRQTSVLRLDWRQITFGETIILQGAKVKSSRRTPLEGFPPVLWEWLKPFARPEGPVARSHYGKIVYDEAKALGIALQKRVFRHSFATFHVAAFRNAAETAQLAGHKEHPRVLWDHYVGVATRKEGLAFYAIFPPETPPTLTAWMPGTFPVPLYSELRRSPSIGSESEQRSPSHGVRTR